MSALLEKKDSLNSQVSSTAVTSVTEKMSGIQINNDCGPHGNKENNSKVVSGLPTEAPIREFGKDVTNEATCGVNSIGPSGVLKMTDKLS